MKKVLIKKLSLLNFKGVKSLSIDVNEEITEIYGDNATGKTTVADAWSWLLFGKDTQGRSDFDVKTLDKYNNAIPKLDHSVTAVLDIDGDHIEISRILREKWVKKKGSLEAEFSGNTTEYFWDGVPCQKKEFDLKINKIVNEDVFKLITNPFAFDSLKWQDRREKLMEIAGGVSDQEIAGTNPAYLELIEKLSDEKSLDDYKKQVLASVKKAKDELKMIPSRIDEVFRSMPEKIDFEALQSELNAENAKLSSVDEKINDASKAFQSELDKIRAKKIEINNLKSEIELIENTARKEAEKRCTPDATELDSLQSKLNEKQDELKSLESAKETLARKLKGCKDEIPVIEKLIEDRRSEWYQINAEEFVMDEKDCICPTCQRAFETDDIEAKKAELKAAFDKDKADRMARVQRIGKENSNELEDLKVAIKTTEDRLSKGAEKIKEVTTEIQKLTDQIDYINGQETNTQDPKDVYEALIAENKELASKISDLQKLQAEITEEPKADNKELIQARQTIIEGIDKIKLKLQTKDQIARVEARIKELENQERELAQQIADVEKIQFNIENFIKHKIDCLEGKINSKFKGVKFKLFNIQINGGLDETCEALIDGVPFSMANNAARINAGLSIIDTLCDFYGIRVPVFIDNAESITKIADTDSQLIKLVVSEEHKELTVKQ